MNPSWSQFRRPWRSWAWDVIVAGISVTPVFVSLGDTPHPGSGTVLAVIVAITMLARRLEPAARSAEVVSAVMLMLTLADVVLDTDLGVELPTFVAVYTLAATGARWSTLAAGVAMVALASIGASREDGGLVALALFAAIVAAAAGAGLYRAARREVLRQWRERVESLQREQEVIRTLAAATERLRIAQEMHDVVGHHLTVMVTLAQAAATVVPPGGDAADALDSITRTGRDALTETRRMLGVLRGPGNAAPDAPTDAFALTVAAVVSSGLTVSTTGRELLDLMPADLRHALHRVVQEALTNALKYAGPGAAVEITVARDGDDLRLSVVDDGAGLVSPVVSHSGHGVAGMRERLAPWGGTVSAGPAGGGWAVRVHVPEVSGVTAEVLVVPA